MGKLMIQADLQSKTIVPKTIRTQQFALSFIVYFIPTTAFVLRLLLGFEFHRYRVIDCDIVHQGLVETSAKVSNTLRNA